MIALDTRPYFNRPGFEAKLVHGVVISFETNGTSYDCMWM